MITSNQLYRKGRKEVYRRDKTPALTYSKFKKKKPQVTGYCSKVITRTPRKPNSAIRKLARVRIHSTQHFNIPVYIPGVGHNLRQFSIVLVRGGRVKDLPGVKYKCIRNAQNKDLSSVASRKNGRSKYGTLLDRGEPL